jgi:hypothetical protein
MGAWQEVAMDSLKLHPGLACPTLLGPAGGPTLKWPNSRFRTGGLRPSFTLLDTPHHTSNSIPRDYVLPSEWIK